MRRKLPQLRLTQTPLSTFSLVFFYNPCLFHNSFFFFHYNQFLLLLTQLSFENFVYDFLLGNGVKILMQEMVEVFLIDFEIKNRCLRLNFPKVILIRIV